VLLGRNIKLRRSSARMCRSWRPVAQRCRDQGIIEGLVKSFRDLETFDLPRKRIERAADLCRGLTRFATEEAVSRNLTSGAIDLRGLADIQRRIVEMATDRGLVYERGLETFDDIGGQASFKQSCKGCSPAHGVRAWCPLGRNRQERFRPPPRAPAPTHWRQPGHA